jgi:hypothetical protein
VDYTRLTIEEVEAELARTARDVREGFGSLDSRQLNWRPSATAWSVAQCLDHLTHANHQMCVAMFKACEPDTSRTVWQRLPVLPGVFGRVMITSLTPAGTRKFTAPQTATPSASDIDAGVIDRFVDGHQEIAAVIRAVAGRDPGRIIMVSPFIRFITYSVLDGLRIVATHERRHFEQSKRVVSSAGYPVGAKRRSGS